MTLERPKLRYHAGAWERWLLEHGIKEHIAPMLRRGSVTQTLQRRLLK